MTETLVLKNDTLYISGALQLKQAAVLLKQLSKLLLASNIKQVDFSAVSECDTTGILLMLRLQRSVGTSMQFLNVPHRLQALLKLTNLTKHFNL